jgi:hypothetical protein
MFTRVKYVVDTRWPALAPPDREYKAGMFTEREYDHSITARKDWEIYIKKYNQALKSKK